MDRRTAAVVIGLGLLSLSGCAWKQARLADVSHAPPYSGSEPVSLSAVPNLQDAINASPEKPSALASSAPSAESPAPPVQTASRPSMPPVPSRTRPEPEAPGQLAAQPSPVQAPPELARAQPSDPPSTPPETDAKLDPAIQQTALETETPAEEHEFDDDPGTPATVVIARVGETIITTAEFSYAVRDRVRGSSYSQWPREQKARVQREALEYLIDRAMLVQEARKRLKNPKQWEAFKNSIEKEWLDKELPALIARARVGNEFELEKVYTESHLSLTEVRENYMLDRIGSYYMGMSLQDRVIKPSFNEIYDYYNRNRNRAEFQQTAQATWRLIFVPIDDSTNRAAAEQIAQTTLARLQRGEDFASVCKQVSKGPRSDEGGLWSTGYESYASETVNQALKTLPLNQISPLLHDDRGFYIVRVEGRRDAGPKPFSEVQKGISEALLEERYHKAMEDFLQDLRRRIPVSCPAPGIVGTDIEPKQLHPERIGQANVSVPPMSAPN